MQTLIVYCKMRAICLNSNHYILLLLVTLKEAALCLNPSRSISKLFLHTKTCGVLVFKWFLSIVWLLCLPQISISCFLLFMPGGEDCVDHICYLFESDIANCKSWKVCRLLEFAVDWIGPFKRRLKCTSCSCQSLVSTQSE